MPPISSKKLKYLTPKKARYILKKREWMYLLKWKQMKKRKSMKIFWEERETFRNVVWIFICSFNTTIAFLYVIPYYSQQIWKIIFYDRPQICKGMKITVFIENKVICIHRFNLHFFFFCSLFWFKHISCIMLSDNLIG